MAVIGFPVLSTNAAEDTLIKKSTFLANELDFHYDFPEEIEENGQKFTRGFVSYMVLDETHETQTVHETDAETIKDLYTKKYDLSKPETLSGIPLPARRPMHAATKTAAVLTNTPVIYCFPYILPPLHVFCHRLHQEINLLCSP